MFRADSIHAVFYIFFCSFKERVCDSINCKLQIFLVTPNRNHVPRCHIHSVHSLICNLCAAKHWIYFVRAFCHFSRYLLSTQTDGLILNTFRRGYSVRRPFCLFVLIVFCIFFLWNMYLYRACFVLIEKYIFVNTYSTAENNLTVVLWSPRIASALWFSVTRCMLTKYEYVWYK